jgi:NAD-dependent deacetylase
MNDADIQRAARLIHDANYMVALTGAGISTPSGIPDFRSPHSGIWEDANAVETASIFGFKRNPVAFFNWMRPLARLMVSAAPNPAHKALADLERGGYLKSIITQNIDMLHSKAGSETVFEVHGHLRKATCIECFEEYDAEPFLMQFIANGAIPHCQRCGGILKPNVILIGEQLPVRELFAAKQAARQCDLLLIIGSSLQVAPAGDIPTMVKAQGAHLIIINYQPTHVDSMADVVFRDNIAEVLPRIAATVMEGN